MFILSNWLAWVGCLPWINVLLLPQGAWAHCTEPFKMAATSLDPLAAGQEESSRLGKEQLQKLFTVWGCSRPGWKLHSSQTLTEPGSKTLLGNFPYYEDSSSPQRRPNPGRNQSAFVVLCSASSPGPASLLKID